MRLTFIAPLLFVSASLGAHAQELPGPTERKPFGDPEFDIELLHQIPTWTGVDPLSTEAKVVPYTDSVGTVVRFASVATVHRKLENFKLGHPHSTSREEREDFEYGLFYRRLNEFKNVRACLIESEQDVEQPDISKIDWTKIDYIEDAYACYLLIFSSYKSAADIANWLDHHDFRISGHIPDWPARGNGPKRFYLLISGRPPPFKIKTKSMGEWIKNSLSYYWHSIHLHLDPSLGLFHIYIIPPRMK